MKNAGLSTRLVILLAALAVALFSLSIIFTAHEDPVFLSDQKSGPGAYSTSSLGYLALYDLLKRTGWTVIRGDGEDVEKRGGGLLVHAEPPNPDKVSLAEKDAFLPERTLLILPKWDGTSDPHRSRWIMQAELVATATVNKFIASLLPDGRVIRKPWPSHWRNNPLKITPTGPASNLVQLLQSDELLPIVASKDGVLLGELWFDEQVVWVLSDPDVLSNHGIGNGDNAAFVLAMLNFIRDRYGDDDMAVVFDETLHGYRQNRSSPLRLLFEFPFVVATGLAFVSALLLVLAGAARFGPPERTADPLGFGKAGLIDNSARLMEKAGHQDHVLRSYTRMAMAATGTALHAPPGLDDTALAAWLDRVGRTRRAETAYAEVVGRLRSRSCGRNELLRDAQNVHRWRRTLLETGPQSPTGPA